MRKFLCLLIGLVGWALSGYAGIAPADSIRFSLMTCAPGTEIYALFGHTAIRYENFSTKEDWVYNYGMFSFSTPNFVMRFVKGETDYQLGKIRYIDFEAEYELRGSSVCQQVLNLSAGEKIKLHRLLEDNYSLKNRTYRYNYFFDNCTSRARDKIEECIDGKVVYPVALQGKTFRSIVHEYTADHEWSELGIDLCLGSEADEPIDGRKQMFAPFYLRNFVRDAQIQRGDTIVPLVQEEFMAVSVPGRGIGHALCSPMSCALFLLALTGVMTYWSIKKRKVMWLWDAVLFGAQGLGGCIIAFLFFFSVHPTVGSNWMILLLNPVPLIYLPVLIYKGIKGEKDYYHWINIVYLTFFIILMPFIQQKIHATILPLTLSLLLCSAGHVYLYYKKKS